MVTFVIIWIPDVVFYLLTALPVMTFTPRLTDYMHEWLAVLRQ